MERHLHTSPNMFGAVVLRRAYARDTKHMAWGLALSRLADVCNTFCHKNLLGDWLTAFYQTILSLVHRELFTLTEILL